MLQFVALNIPFDRDMIPQKSAIWLVKTRIDLKIHQPGLIVQIELDMLWSEDGLLTRQLFFSFYWEYFISNSNTHNNGIKKILNN